MFFQCHIKLTSSKRIKGKGPLELWQSHPAGFQLKILFSSTSLYSSYKSIRTDFFKTYLSLVLPSSCFLSFSFTSVFVILCSLALLFPLHLSKDLHKQSQINIILHGISLYISMFHQSSLKTDFAKAAIMQHKHYIWICIYPSDVMERYQLGCSVHLSEVR